MRELFRKGYRLIDLQNRPTAETPSFGVLHLPPGCRRLLTRRLLWIYAERHGLGCPVSIRDDQIVRELSHYIYEHPAEQMALMPVYDAARDHAQRGTCTHASAAPS